MVRALLRRLLGRGDARTSGADDSGTSDSASSDPDSARDDQSAGEASSEDASSGEEPTDEASDADGQARGEPEDDGSVWDFIPYWQYQGRHVESGGATKGEQERALREIQEQARAIEAHEEADAMEHPDDR